MNRSVLLHEIEGLALSEKILLVEDIWDSIADSIARGNHDLPLPEWQRTTLEKRYTEYQRGKTTLRDWREVHDTLRTRV